MENNFLGMTSSDKLDKAVEKIKNGDKSLTTLCFFQVGVLICHGVIYCMELK